MKSMVSIIFLLFVLLCSPVYAERSLTFGVWTEHYSGDHTEGVDNHLVAFEHSGFQAAWFKNSYGKETAFFGLAFHTKKLEKYDMWLRANVYPGILIGYGNEHPINWGVFSPAVYPTVSIGKDVYSVEVGVMPTFWWVGFKVEF
jgi:hypothetical protein